jgi:hypothetical protein
MNSGEIREADYSRRFKNTIILFQPFDHNYHILRRLNRQLQQTMRGMLTEIMKIVRLIVTVPLRTCSTEMAFSSLRGLQTNIYKTR